MLAGQAPTLSEVVFDLTVPQSDFFLSEAPYVAAVAGFGSGKTTAAIAKITYNKLRYPTIDQAYLAPSYSLIKSIFYPRMADILSEAGFDFSINKSDHEIIISKNQRSYGKIYCRTMNDPDMIVGWECGDAVMDEFDLLPTEKAKRAMDKVAARCRQKFPDGKVNQKMVTTTPEGFKATYQLFKKSPIPSSQLIQMSTYSNEANLPPGYIDDLVSKYPAQLIDAYLNGEFVNLQSGTVYYAFDRTLHNTHYTVAPRENVHIGMDFNVYKMSAIVHVRRKEIMYAADEVLNLRDTPDMIEALKEKYPHNPIYVYPDSSGRNRTSKGCTISDIKLLKEAGFIVRAKKANPLIRDRVNSMNGAFNHGRYYVNTERCQFYTECLEQQVYDQNGQPEKDGFLDNPLDAGGYCISYMMPVVKPFVKEAALGGL